MCEFNKLNKMTVEKAISLLSITQGEPLLSREIQQQYNQHNKLIKYKFYKPHDPPIQPIKTLYQYAEKVKTDCVREETMPATLGPDYDSMWSQNEPKKLTFNMANQISESYKRVIQIILNNKF